MGERLLCKQEVVGSIPITSTRRALSGAPEARDQKAETRMERDVGSRLFWLQVSGL